MKAEHLNTFSLVAEHGSLSKAAAVLGISQPAVSAQLAALQRTCDRKLYQRTAHGIELTPDGVDLLPYARAVSYALEQAARYGQQDPESNGATLHIGLSHHLVPRYTGPLLRAAQSYQRAGRMLELHLSEDYSEGLRQAVARRELDAALVLGAGDGAGLMGRDLGREAIYLLVKPDDPVGAADTAPWDVLEGETLVVSSSRSRVYGWVKAELGSLGVHPGRWHEVSGPGAVKSAVMDGLGIGVTLGSFVSREVAAGWLRLVRVPGTGLALPVTGLMQRGSKKARILNALLGLGPAD